MANKDLDELLLWFTEKDDLKRGGLLGLEIQADLRKAREFFHSIREIFLDVIKLLADILDLFIGVGYSFTVI